jgi:3-keto-5-aminohexanoate cleavage enzyme
LKGYIEINCTIKSGRSSSSFRKEISLEPLIITATPNICWLNPKVEYPKTPEAIAKEAQRCKEAGAAILHIHAEGQWAEVLKEIRSHIDLVIQCGMSSLPIPERLTAFESKADMISIILNHHDEAFANVDFNVLHAREELIEYTRLCKKYNVIPEWEVWHTGSIWNLNYLIREGLIEQPHITTLFFGWPGGTWSPPTIEEYLYRRRLMPEGCVCNVSVMGEGQLEILTTAILNGDHVRVGTEDQPLDRSGQLADTPTLVREVADLSLALGRPLATVEDVKAMVGM